MLSPVLLGRVEFASNFGMASLFSFGSRHVGGIAERCDFSDAIWKFGDQSKRTTHPHDIATQCRQQHVAAALDFRDAALIHMQRFGHVSLCQAAGLSEITESDLFVHEFFSTRRDFGAPLCRQLGDDLIKGPHVTYLFFLFCLFCFFCFFFVALKLAMWLAKRSSATRIRPR